LGHPSRFHKGLVDERFLNSTDHFDVFTHHSRFDARGVDQIMPQDTKKLVILREPTALFESLYNYYNLSRVGYYNTLEEMLMDDTEVLKSLATYSSRLSGKIGFNQVN